MDAAASAPPPPAAASDGRVATHRPPLFHARTSSLHVTRVERRPYEADAERHSRVIDAILIYDIQSSRSRSPSRNRARLAASSDAVLGLQEVGSGAGTPAAEECAVCLQDFVAEDKLRAMPCSHTFHQDCIFRWLEVNHVCPLCRHELPTQEEEEEDDEEDERGYQEDVIYQIYREMYSEETYLRYFSAEYLDPYFGTENNQQESMPVTEAA
ncbi:E3 ubiquitin-protein ligase SIRP1-like isoform X2 [Panicum virgatum]|nr:E3 ubiquitin-protein ligase SIRP1-like isoform X2 [Panicum virgatum]